MGALEGVKCSVSNCRYWKKEKCYASAISVDVDGGGKESPDSLHTQCHTFEPGY